MALPLVFVTFGESMSVVWEKTGDPLGDFIRITFLLEEALERLGAPEDGTLGEKFHAVEPYLAAQDGELVAELWQWVRLRNQVVHRRIPVPLAALEDGPKVVAKLLRLLEIQGYYSWKELDERLEALKALPPAPSVVPTPIEPERARAPQLNPKHRPLEVPKRGICIWRFLRGASLRLPPLRRW